MSVRSSAETQDRVRQAVPRHARLRVPGQLGVPRRQLQRRGRVCSTQNLRARGYDDNLINKAIDKLKSDASLGGGRDLYEANRDVYGLLRYGVKVKPGVGETVPRRSG